MKKLTIIRLKYIDVQIQRYEERREIEQAPLAQMEGIVPKVAEAFDTFNTTKELLNEIIYNEGIFNNSGISDQDQDIVNTFKKE